MSLGKRRQLTPVRDEQKQKYMVWYMLRVSSCKRHTVDPIHLYSSNSYSPIWKMSQKRRSAELYVSFLIVISINT